MLSSLFSSRDSLDGFRKTAGSGNLNYSYRSSSVFSSRNSWVSTPAIKFIVLNRPTLANPSGTIRSVDKGIYLLLALCSSFLREKACAFNLCFINLTPKRHSQKSCSQRTSFSPLKRRFSSALKKMNSRWFLKMDLSLKLWFENTLNFWR